MSGSARTSPEGRRRAEIGTYIHFYKKYDKTNYNIFAEKRFFGHKNRSRRAWDPREGPEKNDKKLIFL